MGLYYWFLRYMVPAKLFQTFFQFQWFSLSSPPPRKMCVDFFIKDLEVVELSLP